MPEMMDVNQQESRIREEAARQIQEICLPYVTDQDDDLRYHRISPVIIIYGGRAEDGLDEKIEESFRQWLDIRIPCKTLYLKTNRKAGTLRSRFEKQVDEFVNEAVVARNQVMRFNIAFVFRMEDAAVFDMSLMKELSETMEYVTKAYDLRGFRFFGVFDRSKARTDGYDYAAQFDFIRKGKENGIWKSIYHLELGNINLSQASRAISAETVYSEIGRNMEMLPAADGHYSWRYLYAQEQYLGEQHLCSVLSALIKGRNGRDGQLQDFRLLRSNEKEGICNRFIAVLKEAAEQEIYKAYPLLGEEKIDRLYRYIPRFVSMEETGVLRRKIEYYEEFADAEKAEKVLDQAVTNMGMIDTGDLEISILTDKIRGYLDQLSRELKGSASAVDKVRKHLLYTVMQSMDERLVMGRLVRLRKKLENNLNRVEYIRANYFGGIAGDYGIDLNRFNGFPLLLDIQEGIEKMHSHEAWNRIVDHIRDRRGIENNLDSFARDANDACRDRNGRIAHQIRDVSCTDVSQVIMLDCPGLQQNSMGINAHIDNNPIYRGNQLLSICYMEWNSEESLYRYY